MVDSTIIGRQLAEFTFPVDRSKVRELARSFGDNDPVWHDPEAAQAAGFGSVPMLPTWTVLADHWSEGGTPAMVAALGADLARVLHGEATWEYLAPVHIGDELTTRQTVADVSTRQGKRGGAMTMFTINTDFVNQHGEVAVRRTDILIEREV